MKKSFGKITDGRESFLYILENKNGMKIAVTDLGAALVKVIVFDREGKQRDVVLGYDSGLDYEMGTESIGATVGRFANRIGKGQFTIGDKTYQLSANNGPNTLHGGRDFYVNRLWETIRVTENAVTFLLNSPDGDQGFPGNAEIMVTYSLTEENAVEIRYTAKSDQDTPLNLTNHSYFNLAGHDAGSVLNHIALIHAKSITATDEMCLPNGEYLHVAGTPMDFNSGKKLGADIAEDYVPLKIGNGYDHNYVLEGEGYREVAVISCEETGINMHIKTDMPGAQLYTANYLNVTGKGGAIYTPRSAVCFETQYYPDAINKKEFPGGLLKAGEFFESVTSYEFVTE